MSKYPFDAHTKVALVDAIEWLDTPTLAELVDAVDITCDLTPDGLNLGRSTSGVDWTPWRSDAYVEYPERYQFDASLIGYRYTPPDDEPLWVACAEFRAESYLIVRRGVLAEVPFDAGDRVETYRFRWGKRAVYPSQPDTNVRFMVPLFIVEDCDDALIADTEDVS